ncbi:MAG: cell division protein ZapB [Treponema sp.]|jgi:chromosome segregation ATPase|nr:cell division protein ZapB [Treponema sp.]
MVTLEQVKLLETKVVRTIEYVDRISRENAQLQGKLDSYQKRIDELEVLIQKFREDQGRIEEGILAALDRLNKFEDAIEKSIADPALSRPSPPRKNQTEKQRAGSRAGLDVPAEEPEGVLSSVESEAQAGDPVDQAPEEWELSPSDEEDAPSADNPDTGELDIF